MSQTIATFGQITDQGFIPANGSPSPSDQGEARTVLSQFTLLQIDGPDSEKFLQGQLTCDMQSVTSEQWQALPLQCCYSLARLVDPARCTNCTHPPRCNYEPCLPAYTPRGSAPSRAAAWA